MDNGYLKFEFTSAASRKPMKFYVLAKNKQDLDMFLSQHGFGDVTSSIRYLPEEEFRPTEGTHLLQIYRFKSNHKPGVFNVMTCEDFITRALENISNDLADHSIFGEAILRTDIEFIKLINTLMGKLNHSLIMDYNLADESLLFNVMENGGHKDEAMEMLNEYKSRIGAPSEDIGSQRILQGLYDSVPDNDTGCIYPITVECYISTFTELMIDCYC